MKWQEKEGVFSLQTYEDLVVGTATQLAQTYVKCHAVKEASQHAPPMLESSMPMVMTDDALATKGAGGTICIDKRPKLAPVLHEAPHMPTTHTYNLLITGPVVVSTSDYAAVSGAIAAQKYQELSLRLQQEYHWSLPKPLVDCPSMLESSMPKSKKSTMGARHTVAFSYPLASVCRTPTQPKPGIPSVHARKSESDWCSESSKGSQRDPTVPFQLIIDRSCRSEEMGLSPVNVTYGGSDAVQLCTLLCHWLF